MASAFEKLIRYGPATFVLKAIIASIAANFLLLGFILLRRAYRKRYFAKHDRRMLELRQNWNGLISGQIPYETWRKNPFDRRIVEDLALDAFEVAASPQECARLLGFIRASGLLEKQIFHAKKHRGWRRRQALVALGRTRAPEGVPALSDALQDTHLENRNAALRALGRVGSPEAAQEILSWLAESGLTVPALPLQNALINCCRERPSLLLPYLKHAEGPLREVLGRVLGEVAGPSLVAELIPLAQDVLPELRAAAARAFSHAPPAEALLVLPQLAQDAVWFVRLRAVVALGQLHRLEAIPHLLTALTDANRLVRMRAAEALVDSSQDQVLIFAQVVAMGDSYGLQAYIAALENAGVQEALKSNLKQSAGRQAETLLNVWTTGKLALDQPASLWEEVAPPVGSV